MSPIDFSRAIAIADAVLYEGYALYPYRASARKNRYRWQFGVVFPPGYALQAIGEHWALQVECIVAGQPTAQLCLVARFLQLETRQVEAHTRDGSFLPVPALQVGDTLHVTWDEGVERVVRWEGQLQELLSSECYTSFQFDGTSDTMILTDESGTVTGRVIRRREQLCGLLALQATMLHPGASTVRILIENQTPWPHDVEPVRAEALRFAFVGTHLLLGVTDGAFISMIDPPPPFKAAAERCRSHGLWPVLVGEPGERTTLLAAPIILEDYPRIAPESPCLLYDGTEIDELLIHRTLLLTEEEKREARATDPRIAQLLDNLEGLAPAALQQLHGAIRSLRSLDMAAVQQHATMVPGQRVRLRPKLGRGDVQDVFLDGKEAIIEEVRTDVTGTTYVGVTLADDPDADLFRTWRRFRYFTLDELELLQGESECHES